MAEHQSLRKPEIMSPLAQEIQTVFDRRATKGERKLILKTYQQKFEQLVVNMPREQRDTAMIKIQRLVIKVGGYVSEYSARFIDYVRNAVLWPMVAATTDFPRDKYYQIELARAKAWGNFALDTTRTATAERMAYRDYFLPTALTGAETVGFMGTFVGAVAGGVKAGTLSGAAVGGLYGAAAGAAIGAAAGGSVALAMRLKDRILGPPVLYYSLNRYSGSSGGSGLNLDLGNTASAAVTGT